MCERHVCMLSHLWEVSKNRSKCLRLSLTLYFRFLGFQFSCNWTCLCEHKASWLQRGNFCSGSATCRTPCGAREFCSLV